jgi:hypothetical protein
MKYVYVISVLPEYALPKISSEAYETLERAQRFIENRSDEPKRVNDFTYKGRNCTYTIHELLLR